MMSMNLSNIAIVNIHGVDYHCIINRTSNQNIDLTEKGRTL